MAGNITRASMLLYLEPVVSVLGAAVFLGEHVTLMMIGGGLLIMAGVAIGSTGRHGESKENSPSTGRKPGTGTTRSSPWT